MKAAITTIVKGADPAVYALDGDNNAHITKPLNVSGSVQEGNSYGSEVYLLNVVVLTPEQKAAVETATGTAYDYCDTEETIPDGINVTIYADEECTQKVGSTAKTEYTEEVVQGDLFNLQDGESISAGTYYARRERGSFGENSHAEGAGTTASGNYSHAEGNATIASGGGSHVEGYGTIASGNYSHAEGNGTIASGSVSHAEGAGTIASGNQSHAEGAETTASGGNSHAENFKTTASGAFSHAEGRETAAIGSQSHAEGRGTVALQENQHVCGQYNVVDGGNMYMFIVGNGTNDDNRRNAFAITKDGKLVLSKADGTPVILDGETLEALIASV